LVIGSLAVMSAVIASAPAAVWPGTEWEPRSPAECGLDEARLRELAEYAGGHGCVVRHGFMVLTWGDPTARIDVASAVKPWYVHFLIRAVEHGLIGSIDDPLVQWDPRLAGLNRGKDSRVSWRHLANQVSCYGVSEEPGTAFDYSDYNMALLFDTLFNTVYGTSWEKVDEEVLHPLLTDRMGCQDDPTFMAFGTDNRPGRLGVSMRDFARFGLLYLRGGEWNGERLISREHVKLVTTSPLSNDIPRTKGEPADMIEGQRTLGGGNNQCDHLGSYSFAWWTNGVDREGNRHWPDVPTDAYGAFGHGGIRAMVILPSLDMILCWNEANMKTPEMENHAIGLAVKAGEETR